VPSSPIASGDARLDSAAFHRNHEPIWAALSRRLEDKLGNVLEVGSGTGQHIIEFARKALTCSRLSWNAGDTGPNRMACWSRARCGRGANLRGAH
jgi:hypothetical protein